MDKDRNHILSRGYISNWAVDGVVECELVASGQRLPLGPSQIGVRKKFYAESAAPDGSRSAQAAEDARGACESKALPILRDLPSRWPLVDPEDRAWVALWIAMTLCGSPSHRKTIPHSVNRFFDEVVADVPGLAAISDRERPMFAEPSFEIDAMFDDINTTASVIGHMHWTLLEFGRALLVSSDSPISTVFAVPGSRARPDDPPIITILRSVEVRLPASPTTALLLSWFDEDDRVPPVRGALHYANPLNRTAWRQAEQHRFWRPGTRPRGVDDKGRHVPLSRQIHRSYDVAVPKRLAEATGWVTRHYRAAQLGSFDRSVLTAVVERDGPPWRLSRTRHGGDLADAFAQFTL